MLILAFPRGGVPVGFEIAKALHVPLDVVLVRKLGVPGHEELAMGAITTGGVECSTSRWCVCFRFLGGRLNGSERRRNWNCNGASAYTRRRAEPMIRGRVVILVDDGIATGATMRVAIAGTKDAASRLHHCRHSCWTAVHL